MSIIQHQITHAAFDAALSQSESALCAESGLSIAQVQTRLSLLTPLLADAKGMPLLLHFPPAEGLHKQEVVAIPAAPVVLLTAELSALLAEQPPRMYSFDRQEMVRMGS